MSVPGGCKALGWGGDQLTGTDQRMSWVGAQSLAPGDVGARWMRRILKQVPFPKDNFIVLCVLLLHFVKRWGDIRGANFNRHNLKYKIQYRKHSKNERYVV